MRRRQLALTLTLLSCLLFSNSHCNHPTPLFLTRYTCIEITDSKTAAAVSDVRVTVARIASGEVGLAGSPGVPTNVAPVGEDGHVCFPITSWCYLDDRIFDGDLRIMIERGADTETLETRNEVGAASTGQAFSVRVTDIDAEPMRLTPCLDLESDPPIVHIDGYLSILWVCDNETGNWDWRIRTLLDYPYVGSVILGEIPEGFILRSGIGEECRFPSGTDPQLDQPLAVVIEGVGASNVGEPGHPMAVPNCEE